MTTRCPSSFQPAHHHLHGSTGDRGRVPFRPHPDRRRDGECRAGL